MDRGGIGIGCGIVAVLVVVVFAITGCRVIEDGEAGLKATLGDFSDQPLGTGVHFAFPVFQKIETWDLKTNEEKFTFDAPTSENMSVGVEASVIYRPAFETLPSLRTSVGADWRTRIFIPTARSGLREVIGGHTVAELYSATGRESVQTAAQTALETELGPRGIIIESVLLRSVDPPQAYQQAVIRKMEAEQKAAQKQHEKVAAEQDAEIEVTRATGVAEANKIIGDSLQGNEGYLRWLWIEGLKAADAAGATIIYVPTEGGLPILEASRHAGP